MEGNKRFVFDRTQAYRLVAVTDKEGNDKVQSRDLYKDRINCVAVNFRFHNYASDGKYYLETEFVQDENGSWCNRKLYTSFVERIEATKKGMKVHTLNSIYIFEKTDLKEVTHQKESELIELFMSVEDDYLFGKGFYYDAEKHSHELEGCVHIGTFQDSVLVCFKPEDTLWGCVCRYFPRDIGVEFYDTIYNQQEYITPMLIHNTSNKKDLVICFEMYPHVWTIKPLESKRIVPYLTDGADSEYNPI